MTAEREHVTIGGCFPFLFLKFIIFVTLADEHVYTVSSIGG